MKEVRLLLGKLLRVCEVARAGKGFHTSHAQPVGPSSIKIWQENVLHVTGFTTRAASTYARIPSPDVEFWLLLFEGALGSPLDTLQAPLASFRSLSYSRTLWSDASENAIGGCFFRVWRVVERLFPL